MAKAVAIEDGVLTLRLPLLPVAVIAGISSFYVWFHRRQLRRSIPHGDDADDFVASGLRMLKFIVEYRQNLCKELPIVSAVKPNQIRDSLPKSAPEQPESMDAVLQDLRQVIVPGLTHWQDSSRFFAYFKPHSAYPAVLGDMMAAGFNVMGFDWIASPACTELEVVTLDWLGQILNLPSRFLSSSPGPGGSVIQTSAGEACIVVLLAATRAAQRRKDSTGQDVGRDGFVVYASDQAHAIVTKACMVLGLTFRSVATSEADNFELRGEALARAIEADLTLGLTPVACVATSGTTTSCAFDRLPEIADVCATHDMWLHIDAAYGGAYSCLPEYATRFAGLERCDSFCVNAHKKLMIPFDLAALYLADRKPVLEALALTPEYLRNAASESGAVVDYEHWQLGLGRRFRALKLWFVLRRFGASGVREHVRRGTSLAQRFASRVQTEAGSLLELAAPVSLSLVCFRFRAEASQDSARDEALQTELLEGVKRAGIFIIHSKLGGRKILRLACGGLEQKIQDVDAAFDVIKAEASLLMRRQKRALK
eukprot:TRINITY_DN28997_c0_g1_i1.p1 TRINITY_DN28997_c0_g1~~TRINITY_DN28997_c0_g1_i1.p1  ORF type:complete len:557 (+),score=88.69 TRINITY_DN28997_c0_g1_i1:55-1671(+)